MAVRRTDWTGHGLVITHTVSALDEPSPTTHHASSDNGLVRLHFAMRGAYSVRYPEMDRAFDLVGGQLNALYATPFEFDYEPKTRELETFGVQFPVDKFVSYVDGANDELMRFCDKITADKPAILLDPWAPITPAIASTIRQIQDSDYDGPLKDTFVLSKGIELLVQSVESSHADARAAGDYVKTSSDRERLVAARDLVNARLSDPPTLSAIAKQIGINEYKLKRGFKEMFGMTVFGYLTEQRLELAKRYLLDTEKTAAEIAFELGYATPQHFHTAFKQKYGVTPNSIRKAP